ncbi:MAG TPA: alpha/beta hydrolase [Ilumatobacteraceae bacterium]|jgi:epsilon-lactone hydrolase|nr:alpha/beta hydrolase [Ilumatobacteraceae bacterium]
MSISWQARTARRAISRYARRPRPEITQEIIDRQRRAMDAIDRLPRPRGLDYADTLVGGVPAIVATPRAARPDRHLLYIHGGAYVVGSPKSHIAMAAVLARLANASATVIEYRLAPEHLYPAALDDCIAAYRALVADVDPSTITIAGDSAGGNAALATLVALRDAGDPMPGAGYLLSPWTDLTGSGESVVTHAGMDPMLLDPDIPAAGRTYAGDVPLDHPGVSPLFADLQGLPPLLIQTGLDEVLLSDSTRLAEKARAAGVDVTLDLSEGMWHVYQSFVRFVPEAREALTRAAVFIRSRIPALETHGVPA